MDRYVITIARQYGSGGRTIGEMLANRLGIHFYDKELMKLASEDSGINERLFNTADEKDSRLMDGRLIRRCAIDNNVYVFTCLDTVNVLLDVLEEITMKVSVIDEE